MQEVQGLFHRVQEVTEVCRHLMCYSTERRGILEELRQEIQQGSHPSSGRRQWDEDLSRDDGFGPRFNVRGAHRD